MNVVIDVLELLGLGFYLMLGYIFWKIMIFSIKGVERWGRIDTVVSVMGFVLGAGGIFLLGYSIHKVWIGDEGNTLLIVVAGLFTVPATMAVHRLSPQTRKEWLG
jgi:hypothetical protein